MYKSHAWLPTAVSHEKGKITVLQLSALLKQADSSKRKLTLTRLASAPIPFTVLSLTGNPWNEDFLAVCGLKVSFLDILTVKQFFLIYILMWGSIGRIIKSEDNGFAVKGLTKNKILLALDRISFYFISSS